MVKVKHVLKFFAGAETEGSALFGIEPLGMAGTVHSPCKSAGFSMAFYLMASQPLDATVAGALEIHPEGGSVSRMLGGSLGCKGEGETYCLPCMMGTSGRTG